MGDDGRDGGAIFARLLCRLSLLLACSLGPGCLLSESGKDHGSRMKGGPGESPWFLNFRGRDERRGMRDGGMEGIGHGRPRRGRPVSRTSPVGVEMSCNSA